MVVDLAVVHSSCPVGGEGLHRGGTREPRLSRQKASASSAE